MRSPLLEEREQDEMAALASQAGAFILDFYSCAILEGAQSL